MKTIILFLIIGLSLSYDPDKAVSYARQYCKKYNTDYKEYDFDGTNFVSQCLIAGGQDFEKCVGVDNKGSIYLLANLKACLIQKGWKTRANSIPNKFKPGYPFIGASSVMIATDIKDDTITYCKHSSNTCDATTTDHRFIFFYLPD